MTPQEQLASYVNDPRWAADIALWQRQDNNCLCQEYLEMTRAMFGMFGNNAKTARNLIAAILLLRGIEIINIGLGLIPIKLV